MRIYTGRPKQEVVWEGQTYESYRDAARKLGVSVETVRQRHLRGQKSFSDFIAPSKYEKHQNVISVSTLVRMPVAEMIITDNTITILDEPIVRPNDIARAEELIGYSDFSV